jgi:hypothetical protein
MKSEDRGMIRQHYPGCRLAARTAVTGSGLALVASLAAALFLAACGSGSGQAPSAASAAPAACTQISATLSDGPDPGADPVGYAEAQIKPLRAIKTPDPALGAAIGDLASAYASVFAADGKSATATRAVAAASKKVNAICPGATS